MIASPSVLPTNTEGMLRRSPAPGMSVTLSLPALTGYTSTHASTGLTVQDSGTVDAVLLADGGTSPISITPASLGFPPPLQGALRGGTAEENAVIVRSRELTRGGPK